MTPADARWLLAQPETLRRALADVPGPGWECFDRAPDPVCTVKAAPHYRFDEVTGCAWGPCDPFAIAERAEALLRATRPTESAAHVYLQRTATRGDYVAQCYPLAVGCGPTAFRAAVALMAASLRLETVEVRE